MDTNLIKEYVASHMEELYTLHRELCLIPAPSHHEERRAAYCLEWFNQNLGEGAYIDEALNVIFPYGNMTDSLTVVCAHTDTVFPDMEAPMPFSDDGKILRSPGVGDDTASLAVLMMVAKYFVEHRVDAKEGILFVANSCEEGLGNLKGTRRLFADYSGRIKQFVSFDAKLAGVTKGCVGSHRYSVEVKTAGGHSWGAFGNRNSIAEIAKIANAIYSIDLPRKEGSRVTYNIGTIEGGTSVNTIAQSASMLCEYRSDDLELLGYMQARFDEIFAAAAATEGVEVKVTKVGDRPCMGVIPDGKQEALVELAAGLVREVIGGEPRFGMGSTDCNIPLSMGIPAVAVGVYNGGGAHTREEWVEKASMVPGYEYGIRLTLELVK